MDQPHLLSLPPELRTQIYTHLAPSDLTHFLSTQHQPGLLKTSHQLRNEYSSIFFTQPTLQIDAYNGDNDSSGWHSVSDPETRRRIFENALFTDLEQFRSLAGSRRYCQRIYADLQGGAETGILTVRLRGGEMRTWQWCLPVM